MTAKKTVKRARTVAEKLAAATRTRDTFTLYLPGDLRAEWNRVKAEFDHAKARDTDMLHSSPETKKLAKRLSDIEEQMREESIDITVQALRRERTPATPAGEVVWNELSAAHPPRKGDDGKPHPHDAIGVNAETFPEALIRASVVDPELTAEEWDHLLYELITDAQYDGLFGVCWRLNRGAIDVPFSSLASKTLTSAPRSSKPSASASRGNGSAAGSPKK